MCKFNVLGINPAALKRQLKEDRKTNSLSAGWSEEGGSTYYTNETEACLIQQKYLDIFEGCTITMKGRNSGIRVECGYMEAYILPMRCKDEEHAIMRAICCNEKED